MLPRFYRQEADLRKQQINTLKIFNDNVKEFVDDYEYEVSFKSGENNLALRIVLEKNFPKEKPLLKVIPPVVHHWVNADGIITLAPGLLNFTVHSDLGRVVQAVIREFQRNPPSLVANNPTSSSGLPILNGEKGNSANYSVVNNFSPPSNMPVSNRNFQQSFAFPELNILSLEELHFLNENEDRQQEFVEDLPYIKEQAKAIEGIISQVEDIAEKNIAKQEQIQNLRKGIDESIEEVTKLAFENERLHVKYQNLSESYSPRNIQEKLRWAAQEAEEECDKIAEAFLQGKLDIDTFLLEFLKTRTLCQNRKTKEEKLGYQLDTLEKAGF